MKSSLKVELTPTLGTIFRLHDSGTSENERISKLFDSFGRNVTDLIKHLAEWSGADVTGEKIVISLEIVPETPEIETLIKILKGVTE